MELESISQKIQQKIKERQSGEVTPTALTEALFEIQDTQVTTRFELGIAQKKLQKLNDIGEKVYQGDMLEDFKRAIELVSEDKRKEANESLKSNILKKAGDYLDIGSVLSTFMASSPILGLLAQGAKKGIGGAYEKYKTRNEELSMFDQDLKQGLESPAERQAEQQEQEQGTVSKKGDSPAAALSTQSEDDVRLTDKFDEIESERRERREEGKFRKTSEELLEKIEKNTRGLQEQKANDKSLMDFSRKSKFRMPKKLGLGRPSLGGRMGPAANLASKGAGSGLMGGSTMGRLAVGAKAAAPLLLAAGAVGAAGYAGYQYGSKVISPSFEAQLGEDKYASFGDTLGTGADNVLQFFGNEDQEQRLEANRKQSDESQATTKAVNQPRSEEQDIEQAKQRFEKRDREILETLSQKEKEGELLSRKERFQLDQLRREYDPQLRNTSTNKLTQKSQAKLEEEMYSMNAAQAKETSGKEPTIVQNTVINQQKGQQPQTIPLLDPKGRNDTLQRAFDRDFLGYL